MNINTEIKLYHVLAAVTMAGAIIACALGVWLTRTGGDALATITCLAAVIACLIIYGHVTIMALVLDTVAQLQRAMEPPLVVMNGPLPPMTPGVVREIVQPGERMAGTAARAPEFIPPWDEAPGWAQWFAVDGDGAAYWYAFQPRFDSDDRSWYPAGEVSNDNRHAYAAAVDGYVDVTAQMLFARP